MLHNKVTKLLALMLAIILLCGVPLTATAKTTGISETALNDKNIQYYTALFGFGEEDVREIYNEDPANFKIKLNICLKEDYIQIICIIRKIILMSVVLR